MCQAMTTQVSAQTVKRRVTLLAVGFFSLFLAYNTAQLLQTAVNGSSGYTCLGLVYGWFAVSSVVSPYFVFRFGPRCLLAPSAVAYVLMTASYLAPDSSIFLLSSCFSVGVSAAFLWTSQGSYIGECASTMAKSTNRAMTDCTSELNANFYSIFATSSGVSAAFSFAFLSLAGADSIRTLFVILTLCGCAGITLLAVLADPQAPHNAAMRYFAPKTGASRTDPTPLVAVAGQEEERVCIVQSDSLAGDRPAADAPDTMMTAEMAAAAAVSAQRRGDAPHVLYMVGAAISPSVAVAVSLCLSVSVSPPHASRLQPRVGCLI
jgi:hypothetical protein